MKMRQLPSGEKGFILVWSVVGLALLIAFAGLATDIPYLYVARQQAQTAADAGALAGAYGLLISQTKAMTEAKAFAGQNPIIGQSLTSGQLEILLESSTGGTTPDQVRCGAYRDVAHGNPMPLFLLPILRLFGLERTAVDLSASATARLVNTCSSNCFKPWAPPDRWLDVNGNGKFDNGIDQYVPPTQAGATGYKYPDDNGLRVTLKIGNPKNAITPSIFYPVDFPPLNRGNPVTGAKAYRENIEGCGAQSFVAVGDQVQVEPGNMVGPTSSGVKDLIEADPTAFWDMSCAAPGGCLNSPLGANSPRLIRIPLFDPRFPVGPGRDYVIPINIAGFFIEGVQSNGDVTGRYTLVSSEGGTAGVSCPGLLKSVQLVQ